MIINKVVCENCRKEARTLSDRGWIKMETGDKGRYISLMISNGTKYIDAYSGGRIDFCSLDCARRWFSAFYEAAIGKVKVEVVSQEETAKRFVKELGDYIEKDDKE